MADRVDSMSDAELRTKLVEYGFPVMPITASTRKLLVKKLKLILDNKSKPRQVELRHTLNRSILSGRRTAMADRVDSMSDAELRTKLVEYGFPVMPITASTRKLLVKKLKLILDNKSKPRQVELRHTLNRSILSGHRTAMADRVDSMSDAELRTKLAEHGFPVMPITASTRKLLVKKLKLVLDNKSKPRQVESRRTLARYSSGEDSDVEPERKPRRATTGGNMPPPAGRTRRATPRREPEPALSPEAAPAPPPAPLPRTNEEPSPVRSQEEVETVTTRRITRHYVDRDDYDTGSDSDVDSDRRPPVREPSASPLRASVFARPPSSGSLTAASSSAERLASIRSRLGLSSTLDRPSVYHRPSAVTSSDEIESPYLSNFTRRLSALKSEQPRSSPADVSNGLPRRPTFPSPPRSLLTDYKAASDGKFPNNFVSLALVAVAVLFFFCLIFMYIVKRNHITSVVDYRDAVIPICQLKPKDRPGVNCIKDDSVDSAKNLLTVVYPVLTAHAAAYMCNDVALLYMTDREVQEAVRSSIRSFEPSAFREDLDNLQVLLVNNPGWGLEVVRPKTLYSDDVAHVAVQSADELARRRAQGSLGLAVAAPGTPLRCLLVGGIAAFGWIAVAGSSVAAVYVGVRRLIAEIVARRRRRDEELFALVAQIVETVARETDDGAPYVSVDHVRDTLVPPNQRERTARLWDEAVRFVQRNESRLRTEVQSVDGEDCRVWRWVAARGSPRPAWQGQAFETQEGSVNSLDVSPTACLKIRHMFEREQVGPGLQASLTDALLDKCGPRAQVLHMAVEPSSCCVYVRCASPAAAGLLYRALHGWWYEGRLITVKYLRLQRYLQRFPDSPSEGPFLTRRT